MAIRLDSNTKYATQGTAEMPKTCTMAVWYKPSYTINDGVTHPIFSQYNGGNISFDILKYNGGGSENKIYAGFFTGSEYRAITPNNDTGLVQNTWCLALVTCDDTANVSNFYVNNTLKATAGTLVAPTTSGNRNIGRHDAFPSASSSGDIAHFAVWNRVLTSGERAALLTTVPDLAAPSGLVDYISFEGGSLVNTAGGTDATLVGSPIVVDGPSIALPSTGGFRSRSRNFRAR